MSSLHARFDRCAIAFVAAGVAGPLIFVAFAAAGLSFAGAAIVGALAAVGLAIGLVRALPAAVDGALGRPVGRVLFCLVGLLAVGRTASLAVFMVDPGRSDQSVLWFDPFYVGHSCFSAYYEAAVLTQQGVENVYDPAHYEGRLEPFKLDEFLYPPPFLLLTRGMLAMTDDFVRLRANWFVLEGLLTLAGLLLLAKWIGGREGRIAALLVPAVWVATPTLLTLQTGNFQLGAFALSILGMVAFERGRRAAGGALLGFAIAAKIFPGILVLYLLVRKQWRAVAWTAVFGAVWSAAALLLLGRAPFDAFLTFDLPRIGSGEATAWLANPELAVFAALNHAVPGIVWKLADLGVPGLGWTAWRWVTRALTLALLALTFVAARRAEREDRIARARGWLALLSLMALRSPFVPDHTALLGPLWLLSLLVPEALGRRRIAAVTALGLVFSLVLPPGLLLDDPTRLVLGLAVQLLLLGLLGWTLLRRAPQARTQEAAPAAVPVPA
jgi:hypothetical protein